MARPDRAVLADAGLTVVLGVAFVASTAGATDARALDGLGWALVAANVLPLLALRRAPLLVVAWLCVAYPVWAALEYPSHLLQSLPSLVAVGAAGAAPRPLWWRALALVVPAEMLLFAASGIWPVDLLEIGYVAILFVSAWVLGVVLAARHGYIRALEAQTAALEAARQELARRAVLEERTRIARDLHDRIGQSLAYLAFELDRIVKGTVRDKAVAAPLHQLREDVRGVIREVRDTLYDLRTEVTETQSLPTTLEAYLDRVRERSGLRVGLRSQETGRLPILQEREMWRIAQEAVTNVERHAEATQVMLTWRCDGTTALLEVADDGIGFPVGQAGRLDSYGLLGMRERAASIGATLSIDSEPGKGTRVRCALGTR
jgi:signal transduction histidine kinase